jgi:gliding motility-associated-like protein
VLQVSANGLSVGTYQFLASVADTACVIAQVIIADPLPVDPVITATPTIGCPPLDVQFTDATPGEVVSCAWVFGDGGTSTDCDPAHVYTEPGTYDVTLTVTMANGCTYDTTYAQYISVVPAPTAAFSASPQPANPDFTTIQFTDNSSADVTGWTWDFDTIPPFVSSISEPVVTFPTEPGAYPVQLVVENAAGCTDTVVAFILVVPNGDLDMPNVFSPDGDGVNDRFVPLDEYPGRGRLSIYNRWGMEIFSTTSITVGWSGYGVPEGTYYWIVEALDSATDIKFRSGHVTLLRGR